MNGFALLLGAALAVSPAAVSAQGAPQTHEQHSAAPAQHEHQMAGGEKCCCDQMMKEMHEMMGKMMQMHKGMDMKTTKEAPSPEKEHAH